MTAPDLSAVEQLPQPDVRGILALRNLPDSIQRAEDSTADADRAVRKPRGFQRPSTPVERQLLTYLGFRVPEDLVTEVSWPSTSVRRRRWPTLESQEIAP
jgi:hypothetical protein